MYGKGITWFFFVNTIMISTENLLSLENQSTKLLGRGNAFSVAAYNTSSSRKNFGTPVKENRAVGRTASTHKDRNKDDKMVHLSVTFSNVFSSQSSPSKHERRSEYNDKEKNTTDQPLIPESATDHGQSLGNNISHTDFVESSTATRQLLSSKSGPNNDRESIGGTKYTDLDETSTAMIQPSNSESIPVDNKLVNKTNYANLEQSSTTASTMASTFSSSTAEFLVYEIEVTYESETRGQIQSPSTFLIVKSMKFEREAQVQVPHSYSVLISLPWLRMPVDNGCNIYTLSQIRLYLGDRLEWSSCGTYQDYLLTNLHQADTIRIFLKYIYKGVYVGPKSITLRKEDFDYHLRCNLHVECEGREDETGCDFESEECGPGFISAGGGCYTYIEDKDRLQWYAATALCKEQGGHVASLNTPEEWAAVSKLLERTVTRFIHSALSFVNPALPDMYQHIPMWADQTMAYYRISAVERLRQCNSYDFEWYSKERIPVSSFECSYYDSDILCEINKITAEDEIKPVIVQNVTSADFASVQVVECPDGHRTYTVLACDVRSACWGRGYGLTFTCDLPMTPAPPSFTCDNEYEFVPYSLVCDFREDCTDGSDEDFCVFPPCGYGETNCGNEQCVLIGRICDEIQDCFNGVDERRCYHPMVPRPYWISHLPYLIKRDPITLDLQIRELHYYYCDPTNIKCHSSQLCLPLELRCNGVYDCPGREDEVGCETCPGLYRCRSSAVCLHPDMLCNKIPQCPEHDDELFCENPCPEHCTCFAVSVFCYQRVSMNEFPNLRFLEAQGSGTILSDVMNMMFLVHLGLGSCGLRHLGNASLPNIQSIDLRDNFLTDVQYTFVHQFPNIRVLLLGGNLLNTVFMENTDKELLTFPRIRTLGLSRLPMKVLNVHVLKAFPNLRVLNLSGSGIEQMSGPALNFLAELTTLDVRKCPLTTVPTDLIRNLPKLTTVFADNYKLCCPAMLPIGFPLTHCHAPIDEISSCDALLRSDAYRALLSVFAALALMGNLGSFTYRAIINKSRGDQGFGVFVTHLSISDLLMGLYLAIIGVADRVYLGSYLWGDVSWKSSAVCSMAGFLALISCETSALIICLITLDRFLVLRFPFSQLRFRQKSAHVAAGFVWMIGAILASVPLLPITSNWEFYRQNGICLPLPITQKQFPGQSYSFSVMIVLNLVLFLLIGIGQLSIYYTVKTNTMSSADTNTSSKDLAIARRLITIAVSDFLCWFPIGVLGLLASTGTPISGEVNVAMAILALPLNAALNPFIYTYNMIVERRRKEKEKRLQKIIMSPQQGKREAAP